MNPTEPSSGELSPTTQSAQMSFVWKCILVLALLTAVAALNKLVGQFLIGVAYPGGRVELKNIEGGRYFLKDHGRITEIEASAFWNIYWYQFVSDTTLAILIFVLIVTSYFACRTQRKRLAASGGTVS
jgi:hypothetical protein